MKYVFSKYNVSIERNGYIFSFNTLSRALIKVAKDDFNVDNPFLRDNGFVVKNDEDLMTYKYYYLSRMFDNKNIRLSVATTMSCNLKCPYCFEEGNKSPEFMHDDVADSIVKYLVSKKAHNINITWFGGEPLMNFKGIERISDSLKKNDVTFSASIITNGTLFTRDMIEKLDKYSISSVQITLDGNQAQHDTKGFFANGKGTYAKILENVSLLLQLSNVYVLLKVNLDTTNINSYSELRDSINNLFPEYAKIGRLGISRNYVRNRTGFKGCDTCLSEEEYFDKFYDPQYAINYLTDIATPCPLRSRSDYAIGPDGSIYKCLEFLGNKDKAIGNILTHDIDIRKQASHALSYDPFNYEKCCNCEIFPLCGGGCPIDREKASKEKKPNNCSVIKERIKQIITDYLNRTDIEWRTN